MRLIKPSYEILTDINGNAILRKLEIAGRTCYKSEEKITENSAIDFVTRILKSGHHSVIEHESLSVRFICDRGVTHEIVRHRLASYSQESTRYCNYSGGVTFIIPPWVNIKPGEYLEVENMMKALDSDWEWLHRMFRSEESYIKLLKWGWSPQQARSVLPNSLKTEIIVTANLREWRHILKLRCSKIAHPQMREIMAPLLVELRGRIPVLFDDVGVFHEKR